MNTNRLLRLAVLLEHFEERHDSLGIARFNIAVWKMRFFSDCGTAACAVGTAGSDPAFQAEGLRMDGNLPVFQDVCSWGAVCAFFGIDEPEAQFLFSIEAYRPEMEHELLNKRFQNDVTPLEVAERIRVFVGVARHPEDPDAGEVIELPKLRETVPV